MSEEVKALEKKAYAEGFGYECKSTFWTNIGPYRFDITDIMEVDYDKLKALVAELEELYKHISGHDYYTTIVDAAVGDLVKMGHVLLDAKEGKLGWYQECLRKLIDSKPKEG